MKKFLLLLVSVSMLATSCDIFNNYGKKVKINDKNEVFYKGDGVTENDAKKLGAYLEKLGYFSGTKELSVQLTKNTDAYVVRFVFDKAAYEKSKDQLALNLWYWQDLISENVFDGKRTNIVLADEKMKDFDSIDEINKVAIGKDNHVYYRGKGVSEKDAKQIGEKLAKEDFFSFTGGDILLTQEKGNYAIRFLPNEEKLKENKDRYYAILKNLQYIFTKYTIGETVNLVVIDAAFNDVKEFDEPTAQEKAYMDQAMQQPQQQEPYNQQTQQPYNQTQPTNNNDSTVPTGDNN